MTQPPPAQPTTRGHTLHPVLFALLPVLFLYQQNLGQLQLSELLLPLLVALGSSLLLWGLLRLLVRDGPRAGALASCFWLWLFAFGLVSGLHAGIGEAAFRAVVAAYALLWPALVVLAVRNRRNWSPFAGMLNLMAIILVAAQMVHIASFEMHRVRPAARLAHSTIRVTGRPAPERPNIYFVVLDGYGREDVLQRIYDYDNRDFLRFLESRGFQVAHQAHANYCQTALSLASSLNVTYLDDLARRMGPKAEDRRPIEQMVDDNEVARFLREQGYRITAFASAYPGTEMRSADVYLHGKEGLSDFQTALLNDTPILPLLQACGLLTLDANHARALQMLYTFDHLPEAGRADRPVFVFAHLLVPHPPFIFHADGSMEKELRDTGLGDGVEAFLAPVYHRGYRQQIAFTTRRTETLVDQILAQAPRPTVILLLSDHGPGSTVNWHDLRTMDLQERFGTLLALRLPGAEGVRVPDDLTPVNATRLVLREYFGADLPPLPSVSYASSFFTPYGLTRVTNEKGEFGWPK